jgi:hypothetical protein
MPAALFPAAFDPAALPPAAAGFTIALPNVSVSRQAGVSNSAATRQYGKESVDFVIDMAAGVTHPRPRLEDNRTHLQS